MAFYGDTVSFNFTDLALKEYSLPFQLLAYTAFIIAFGVKLPIFPLHTWLPDAHSEAPAAVSMILAGVLLKMAGYGIIRMNIEMLPGRSRVRCSLLGDTWRYQYHLRIFNSLWAG